MNYGLLSLIITAIGIFAIYHIALRQGIFHKQVFLCSPQIISAQKKLQKNISPIFASINLVELPKSGVGVQLAIPFTIFNISKKPMEGVRLLLSVEKRFIDYENFKKTVSPINGPFMSAFKSDPCTSIVVEFPFINAQEAYEFQIPFRISFLNFSEKSRLENQYISEIRSDKISFTRISYRISAKTLKKSYENHFWVLCSTQQKTSIFFEANKHLIAALNREKGYKKKIFEIRKVLGFEKSSLRTKTILENLDKTMVTEMSFKDFFADDKNFRRINDEYHINREF